MKNSTLLAGWLVLLSNACWSLQLTDMQPGYGAPGDLVTLSGTDFQSGIDYVVRVGDSIAAIDQVQSGSLSFFVPANATSALVSVTEGETTTTYPASLTITRQVSARFGAGLEGLQNQTVGTLYDESAGPGSVHSVPVQKDGVTLVMTAGDDDDEPGLVAVATGLEDSIELSAYSSAVALVFNQPSVSSADQETAALVLNVIESLPQVQTLAAQIGSQIAAGSDYLTTNVVDNALFGATLAYLEIVAANPALIAPSAAPPASKVVGDDFVDGQQSLRAGYPRDLEVAGFEKFNALDATATATQNNARGVPTVGVQMQRGEMSELNELIRDITGFNVNLRFTSLDWVSNLYELDPADPDLDTRAKADALAGSHTAQYARLQARPLARRATKARPLSGNVDLLGTVQDLLIDSAYKQVDSAVPGFLPPNDLRVPADRSGLYIIRSFSGARFALQDPLLGITSGLPGAYAEETKMLALNMVMAINDALGVVLKAKDLLGIPAAAEIYVKLEVSASAMIEREISDGSLDGQAVLRLVPVLGKELIKHYSKKALEQFAMNLRPDKLLGKSFKIALKTLNVFSKVAAVAKTGERLLALSNAVNLIHDNAYVSQAVQSTLVVVGDPWRPEITSFSPRRAHKGRFVDITGRNFSEVPENNIVLFGYAGTDPEGAPATVVAEVRWATSEAISVVVPEGAETGNITVAVIGKGNSSSARLAPPYTIFTVVADPVITAISPNPVRPGALAIVSGQNFARGVERNELTWAQFGNNRAVVANQTSLLVRVPNAAGANSITVTVSGRNSNTLAFEAVNGDDPEDGSLIAITSAGDGNVPDGDITLHEAILIGAGTLGRNLTTAPFPRPPDTTYERDFVTGFPAPGAANEDDIRLHQSFPGGPILVTESLPALPDFDSIDLDDVVIDGQGVAATGYRFDGNKQLRITARFGDESTLRNFSENCMLFTGGARDHFVRLKVENCGENGVLMTGDAKANELAISSGNNNGNGMRMTGGSVAVNIVRAISDIPETFVNNGGFGLLVDGGANFNWFELNSISNNALGGIRVTGENSLLNLFENGDNVRPRVFQNGGPGIWIDTPSTRVEAFNIAGNAGAGVLVEGAMTSDVVLQDLTLGLVEFTFDGFNQGDRLANQGSGVHVTNGAHDLVLHAVKSAGNEGHGIWLDGPQVHDVLVSSATLGGEDFGNDMSGLAITNGAYGNTMGPGQSDYFVNSGGSVILNHTGMATDSGAGVLLSGPGTRDNIIYGNAIGSTKVATANRGNRYGIRITDGAQSNVIGLRGDRSTPTSLPLLQTYNLIVNSLEAGILLESGGSLPNQTTVPGEPPFTPTGGNVIQNNFIGRHQRFIFDPQPNQVGILIRAGGVANRVGGSNSGEGNIIRSNNLAGIQISGGVLNRPELANRIIGNTIQAQGSELNLDCSQFTGVPEGVGVLVSDGASGHTIGGKNPGEGNRIGARQAGFHGVIGNWIGVFIDASDNIQMAGNDLGYNETDRGNTCIGTIILNGSNNFIGPDNRFDENGPQFATDPLGTLVIFGGSANQVMGNWFGPPPDFQPGSLNAFSHIAILDSADNRIGDLGLDNANVITRSNQHGILIDGPGATGNQVSNNYIGLTPFLNSIATRNFRSGVTISGGATRNMIGGHKPVLLNGAAVQVAAGNFINGNFHEGVHVDGAATVRNTIINNSISGHIENGRLGIKNSNGGNSELPPPTLLGYDGTTVEGVVDAAIPAGALVQIFTDPVDEGLHFMAEALVSGGAFSTPAGPWLYENVCATVTHAGNTSEFSCLQADPPAGLFGLDVRRVRNPSEDIVIQAGRSSAVVALKLSTGDGAVSVNSMTFEALGSVDEAIDLLGVGLYLDQDEDGRLSAGDSRLADNILVSQNNGLAEFTDLELVIDANVTEHWLLVVELQDNAALGETVEFRLLDNTNIESAGLFPIVPILETGAFPIVSDSATIAEMMPSGGDISQTILTGAGYDPAMDLNNDGVVDVADAVMAER